MTVTQDKSMLLWRIEDIHYKKIVLIKKAENMHDSVLDHCSVNSNQDLISIVIIKIFLDIKTFNTRN